MLPCCYLRALQISTAHSWLIESILITVESKIQYASYIYHSGRASPFKPRSHTINRPTHPAGTGGLLIEAGTSLEMKHSAEQMQLLRWLFKCHVVAKRPVEMTFFCQWVTLSSPLLLWWVAHWWLQPSHPVLPKQVNVAAVTTEELFFPAESSSTTSGMSNYGSRAKV